MPVPGLKTRRPTGAVPYPCILLEGEEKAGKTWQAALLSASDKVGATYWIDLGEGAADEYALIPGTRYEIVEHDGSYASLAEAVRLVKAEARRAADAGEKPVVLVLDTGSALWEGLREWVDQRARKTSTNRRKLAEDPDAEVKAPNNLWNDAKSRWARVMNPLLTFPGIVVVTSQGREVMKMGKDGRPVEGEKTWRAAVQEQFPYAANVWLRMFRDANPVVVGARSVHLGIRPGKDAEREIKDPAAQDRLLEWLIFDALKCDPTKVTVRDLHQFSAGELTEDERVDAEAQEATEAAGRQDGGRQRRPQQEPRGRSAQQWTDAVAGAKTRERLLEIHAEANQLGQLTEGLLQSIKARAEEIKKVAEAEAPATVPGPEAGTDTAGVDPEEAALADAEHRGMLTDELDIMAELLGVTRSALTRNKLPQGPDAVSTEELQSIVAAMRPLVIRKLTGTDKEPLATAYAKVQPDEFGPRSFLLGDEQPPAQDAAPAA